MNNISEILAFIVYFIAMLAIGFIIYAKSKDNNESDYFLGGRKVNPFVVGLSAQASDMSGWLLMGLPGSILLAGFGKIWIAIGLVIGSYLSWLLIARRLRVFSAAADDSITIPQYLNNRFKSKGLALQVVCAVVLFVCFAVYVASGFKAGATLFNMVIGIDQTLAMAIFGVVIVAYTFTGGFRAVCYTDFVQALMMLAALFIVPIVVVTGNDMSATEQIVAETPNFFNFLPSGSFDWDSICEILNGIAWGLGYFGMPHIIIRYMAIDDGNNIKTARRTATIWVILSLTLAVIIAIVGRIVLPELATNGEQEKVFILLVRQTFPGFISGLLLSAILAAAMSTADSQLLVASSSISSDIYKPLVIRNAEKAGKEVDNAKLEKNVLLVGRIAVIAISVVAFIIAVLPNSGSIMDLVDNAWAGFGAAFGPVIILSLYWKRLTYKGALTGIAGGALTVVVWIAAGTPFGLYELIPGFIIGLVSAVVVSLVDKAPSEEVNELFALAQSRLGKIKAYYEYSQFKKTQKH